VSLSYSNIYRGFSLIELLVVAVLMTILTALIVPAFNTLNSASGLTQAAFEIKGCLDRARSYATANNTYVYVGFAEVDGSVSSSATPQVNTGQTAFGRVTVAVAATKDGASGYDGDVNNWQTNYNTTTKSNLVPLNKLQRFENLHLADLGSDPPTSGNMCRPAISNSTTPSYNIGNAACVSSTPFAWPLGTSLPASATAVVSSPSQYAFYKVIQFDPQGVARIQSSAGTSSSVVPYMEIALQQTRGKVKPSVPSNQNIGNQVAIQIDSMTGATRIYRP
jgi:prepilin-type N-terminal cleavage/methylation domain-containing protein